MLIEVCEHELRIPTHSSSIDIWLKGERNVSKRVSPISNDPSAIFVIYTEDDFIISELLILVSVMITWIKFACRKEIQQTMIQN